jgi:hypothetical protein
MLNLTYFPEENDNQFVISVTWNPIISVIYINSAVVSFNELLLDISDLFVLVHWMSGEVKYVQYNIIIKV